MKNVFLLLVLILVMGGSADVVFGQSSLFSKGTRYDSVKKIQEQIRSLLDENSSLEIEYEEVQKEIDELQDVVLQYEQAFGPLGNEWLNLPKVPIDIDGSWENYRQDSKFLRQQADMNKSRSQYWEGKVDNVEDRRRVWKLKLDSLEYEKQELMMELRLKEFSYQQVQKKADADRSYLENQLKLSVLKEDQLTKALDELTNDNQATPAQLSGLRQEVKQLKEELKRLTKEKNFKEREVALLKDKMTLKINKKDFQKRTNMSNLDTLQLENRNLKEDFEALNEQVATSLTRQNRKQELLNNIMAFDRKNQKIRAEIEDLNLKLEYK